MAEKKAKRRGQSPPTPPRGASSAATAAVSGAHAADDKGLPQRLALLIVAAIAVLAYLNTLGAGLVYDDAVIVKNAHMHDPWRLAAIFGSDFYGGTHAHVDLYRPLTVWTFAINWQANELFGAAGASPFVFHATNVALHAAVSVLVLFCAGALRMSRNAAIAAAVLFAVHPLHTEAVANVYARSELLAALFGLAYLLFHREGRGVLAALALFGAVSSKESALAFWPLALALDAWMPVDGKRVRFSFVTLAAVGVWYSLRMSALAGGAHDADEAFVENPLVALGASERAFAALSIQLLALRLFVFPVGLSSDYSYDQLRPATSLGDPAVLGATLLLVAALATAGLLRRARPLIGVGVIGYVLLWIPASNLLFPIGTIFGERLAYAPTIFGCLLLAVLLELATSRLSHKVFVGVTGAVALVGTVLTVSRNTVWKDEPTLFFDQTQTAPRSAKAHYNLGTALARVGNRRGAADSFERAIAIHEPHAPAQFALANELFLIGDDLPRAEKAYRAAIRAGPELIDARVNLAILLVRLARPEDAQLLADEVRRVNPRHPSLPAVDKQIQEARATKPAPGGE